VCCSDLGEIIDAVENLEQMDNVATLAKMLVP